VKWEIFYANSSGCITHNKNLLQGGYSKLLAQEPFVAGRPIAKKCIFVLKNGFGSVPRHIFNINCNLVCELSKKKVQIGSQNQEIAVK